MDPRLAFLNSVSTLFAAFTELARFRIVGNTALVCIPLANTKEKQKCEQSDIRALKELLTISPEEFHTFSYIFHESCVVIAYSWLEAFLGEVEEALFLHDPKRLGDSVQIKLGKILESHSIEGLIHDLARRRLRERSQWGLVSRIGDLRDHHAFQFSQSNQDLQKVVTTRNNIIHGKRPGAFEIRGSHVNYRLSKRKEAIDSDDVRVILHTIFTLLVELYTNACRVLHITGRFAQHRKNISFSRTLTNLWSADAQYRTADSGGTTH